MTNLFVDEALRAYEHPGIVFRPGPTGRRAALAAGPDIWEIVGALRAVRAEQPTLVEDALREALAEVVGVRLPQVETALRYYAAYPEEVDERLAMNEAEAEREHATWLAQRDLLGPPA